MTQTLFSLNPMAWPVKYNLRKFLAMASLCLCADLATAKTEGLDRVVAVVDEDVAPSSDIFSLGVVNATIGPDLETFTQEVKSGRTFFYRVLAFGVTNQSAWSNTVQVIAP